MTVFLLIILLLCLWKIKIAKPFPFGFNENYLSHDRTDCIKGVFVLLVFLSHSRNYLLEYSEYLADPLNSIYNVIQEHLGQSIVVMFLFYSGFGVMESIKRKGNFYINSFPKNRFAKTLFNFDVAVLLFIFVDLCIGTLENYSTLHIILSFTGWESVGNSNWYIFAVLIMYLITYTAFKIFNKQYTKALVLITVLTVLYIGLLALVKDAWWFDTVLLYPLGMWYSSGKDKIENFVRKNNTNYFCLLIFIVAVFTVSHVFRKNIICYEISQVAFCAVILAVTMKINISNKILKFFGKHLFEFYILMRIPMIILLHYQVTDTYLFVCVSFAATLIMSVFLKKFLSILDGKIFSK